MVACILAAILCLSLRRKPWIVVIWLPSFALTGGYTGLLALQFLRGIAGQGPDSGWFIFAGMMQAMVSFPIVISAVLLLLGRPTKEAWNRHHVLPAIVPTVIAPLVLLVWFTVSKPPLSFMITDEAGKPLQGVAVRDVFDSAPRFTTDGTGKFGDRVPHTDTFVSCFTAEGYQEHHVTVYRAGAHGETYFVDHSWIDRGAYHITVTESQRVTYPSKQSTVIPIMMYRINPLVGLWQSERTRTNKVEGFETVEFFNDRSFKIAEVIILDGKRSTNVPYTGTYTIVGTNQVSMKVITHDIPPGATAPPLTVTSSIVGNELKIPKFITGVVPEYERYRRAK
jgi:hypothetical protein